MTDSHGTRAARLGLLLARLQLARDELRLAHYSLAACLLRLQAPPEDCALTGQTGAALRALTEVLIDAEELRAELAADDLARQRTIARLHMLEAARARGAA